MSGSVVFPKLFEAVNYKRLSLKNRLVSLPHGTNMVRNGVPTDHELPYFEARARGGVGLIITGGTHVHPTSISAHRSNIEPFNDLVLPKLKKRNEIVHSYGTKVVGQLLHLGREISSGQIDYPRLAPTALRSPRDAFQPKEMDLSDIHLIQQSYIDCAHRLEMCAHDGVEIHAAHGYLMAQFLSPSSNKRNDLYGGNEVNRMRFLREVLEGVRVKCRSEFVLGLRLSASEEIADGNDFEATVRITEAIARLDIVDYLNITIGNRGRYVRDMHTAPAIVANMASEIRRASGIPVLLSQRISTPYVAESVLQEHSIDLIGLGRGLMADPDWPNKAAAGQADDIRPCIACNQACRTNAHLHCTVNPETGRELKPIAAKTTTKLVKRVAIVGAGPAGMEAACMAAERGHTVTLFEKRKEVGGQLLIAAAAPGCGEHIRLRDYYRKRLARLMIDTRLESNPDVPTLTSYDTVIVATGANPKQVESGAISAVNLLRKVPSPFGERKAIVADDGTGFWPAYGAAEALAAAEWSVCIATPSSSVGAGLPAESLVQLLDRLGKSDVSFRVLTRVSRLNENQANLICVVAGKAAVTPCDLLVRHSGFDPDNILFDELSSAGVNAVRIGDCLHPRHITHALLDAHRMISAIASEMPDNYYATAI